MSPSKREVIHTPKESKFNRDFAIILCIGLVLLVVAGVVISNLVEQENRHVKEVEQVKVAGPQGSHTEERISDAAAVVKKQVEANPNAESLDLQYIEITDDAMAYVGKLKRLKTLNLQYTRVSDDGLKYLIDLPIEYLNLLETSVTDKGMKYLGQMKNLNQLFLHSTHVTDAGLADLKGLPLGDLSLANTNVTDKGVPSLLPFRKSLWKLDLSDTHVTNACIPTLSQMEALDTLQLGGTDITMTALSKLHCSPTKLKLANTQVRDTDVKLLTSHFPQLIRLNLNATLISDEGLKQLVKLKSLQELSIYHCNLSKAAIAEFSEKRPNCVIINDRI